MILYFLFWAGKCLSLPVNLAGLVWQGYVFWIENKRPSPCTVGLRWNWLRASKKQTTASKTKKWRLGFPVEIVLVSKIEWELQNVYIVVLKCVGQEYRNIKKYLWFITDLQSSIMTTFTWHNLTKSTTQQRQNKIFHCGVDYVSLKECWKKIFLIIAILLSLISTDFYYKSVQVTYNVVYGNFLINISKFILILCNMQKNIIFRVRSKWFFKVTAAHYDILHD